MSDNDTSDQESDDVEFRCPVNECGYTSMSKRSVTSHFGHHDDTAKKDALLDELRRLAKDLSRTPSYDHMDDQGFFSPIAYDAHFGGWNDALKEAGFELNNRFGVPTKELLDSLNRLRDELGHPPTQADMDTEGDFSAAVYIDRFDSWNNTLKEAGMGINSQNNIAGEELLDALTRLADDLGRTPTATHMRKIGEYSINAYQRAFDSWNNALIEAGIGVNKQVDIPDEVLHKSLRTLADELVRVPTAREMNELGDFSDIVYLNRFGSWNEGVKAAGLSPRSQEDWALHGEDHHAWVDGTFSYGPGWNEAKKERVRERDGRICQHPGCDRTEAEHLELFNRKHHVHHIQKARTFDDPLKRNDSSNLITLCIGNCHHTWERMSPLRPQSIDLRAGEG